MDENRMHLGRLVHRIAHQMKRRSQTNMCCSVLTPMQNHILGFILLESRHRELYQKDVEEEFQIRKSTATGILKLMEKNGFIYRESVEKDARLKRIVVTERSEEIRKELQECIWQTERRMTSGITEEDLKVCIYVLDKMLRNLTQEKYEEEKRRTP